MHHEFSEHTHHQFGRRHSQVAVRLRAFHLLKSEALARFPLRSAPRHPDPNTHAKHTIQRKWISTVTSGRDDAAEATTALYASDAVILTAC